MALKFLNKKGWHTGSLRNIENVWKAEQKHEAEQKKLEELRKQMHEERERAEFRQLQEQAGLIPKQERLDFLYDSGLAVGKRDSGFKALESLPKAEPGPAASSSSTANQQQQQSAVPGALFEEKQQSANDSWRKLHSDPLLMIRQREQEALARIKNNPVQMAMIRKSVETQKGKGKDEKKQRKKSHKKKSKQRKYLSSENDSDSEDASLALEKRREGHHKHSKSDKHSRKEVHTSDEESDEVNTRKKSYHDKEHEVHRHSGPPDSKYDKTDDHEKSKKIDYESRHKEYSSERHSRVEDSNAADDYRKRSYSEREHGGHRRSSASNTKYDKSDDRGKSKSDYDSRYREYSSEQQHVGSRHDKRSHFNHSDRPPRPESNNPSDKPPRPESNNRHRNTVKLSEEERAARLREMQMDAELHEEQRWKRLKKAADNDAEEAIQDKASAGRNFLDAAQKSVYGAEKGGSTTIEESVRRRTHYSQGRLASETNAFRRS